MGGRREGVRGGSVPQQGTSWTNGAQSEDRMPPRSRKEWRGSSPCTNEGLNNSHPKTECTKGTVNWCICAQRQTQKHWSMAANLGRTTLGRGRGESMRTENTGPWQPTSGRHSDEGGKSPWGQRKLSVFIRSGCHYITLCTPLAFKQILGCSKAASLTLIRSTCVTWGRELPSPALPSPPPQRGAAPAPPPPSCKNSSEPTPSKDARCLTQPHQENKFDLLESGLHKFLPITRVNFLKWILGIK